MRVSPTPHSLLINIRGSGYFIMIFLYGMGMDSCAPYSQSSSCIKCVITQKEGCIG